MSPYMACAWGLVWENKGDIKTWRFWRLSRSLWMFMTH